MSTMTAVTGIDRQTALIHLDAHVRTRTLYYVVRHVTRRRGSVVVDFFVVLPLDALPSTKFHIRYLSESVATLLKVPLSKGRAVILREPIPDAIDRLSREIFGTPKQIKFTEI